MLLLNLNFPALGLQGRHIAHPTHHLRLLLFAAMLLQFFLQPTVKNLCGGLTLMKFAGRCVDVRSIA